MLVAHAPALGRLRCVVVPHRQYTGETDVTFRCRASFHDVRIDKAGSGFTLVAVSPGFRSDTSAVFQVTP